MSHGRASIGVIGGTGLYDIEGLTGIEEVTVETPFGSPSDAVTIGTLSGVGIAFLPRHGKGHRISPSEVPCRANIHALKSLGVEQIISINAVGSLKEGIKPTDIVIPDQLIDRTSNRVSSFFGDGIVAHISFAEPFCPALRRVVQGAAQDAGTTAHVHGHGTYVVMEGPAFSTRAESFLHRSWGADVVGMTALPEAKLAREAEICFVIIACVTDYDCWRKQHDPVTVDMILETLRRNDETTREIIQRAALRMPEARHCDCATALKTAIVTEPELIPAAQKRKLDLLIGKYLVKA